MICWISRKDIGKYLDIFAYIYIYIYIYIYLDTFFRNI